MPDTKLKKLQEIMKMANDGLTREEFDGKLTELMKLIVSWKKSNEQEWALIHSAIQMFSDKLKGETSASLSDIKKQVNHIFVGERLDEMKKMIDEMVKTSMEKMHKKMGEMDMTVSERMKKVRDGYTPIKGKDYFDGKHGNILAPREVRDKLETLKGDERLDKSAIKGFTELEARVTSIGSRRIQTPAKAFMVHKTDLTSQCDGSNKTFNVGGTHFGIMGVFGTQFPLIYRPIIDYTETPTGFTLTSAVSAPDTGQTLVAQWLK